MSEITITVNENSNVLTVDLIYNVDNTINILEGFIPYAHPNIDAADSTSNTGDFVIQNITLDSNGHVTAIESVEVVGGGGGGGLDNVVEDLTPQLGGNLDVNEKLIFSSGSSGVRISSVFGGDISLNTSGGNDADINLKTTGTGSDINIDATGEVNIQGITYPDTDGTNGQVIQTDGAGNLYFGSVLTEVVQDTSPELGGDLNVNGNNIVGNTNEDIAINPVGTGNVLLSNIAYPNSDGTNGQVLQTDGAGTLSFVTPSSGGTSKYVYSNTFSVAMGDAGRFYGGATVGGVNQAGWNDFRNPYSGVTYAQYIRWGIILPADLENLGFKATIYSSSGTTTITARLLTIDKPTDGTSRNDTLTATQIGSDSVTLSSTDTMYSLELAQSPSNTASENQTLVLGFESDGVATVFGSYTIFADYA